MKRIICRTLLFFLPMIAITASAAQLPFIQDNYAKARAVGQRRNLPIFVECWAPW